MRRGLTAMAVVFAAGMLIPAHAAEPIVKRAGPTVGEFVTQAANAGRATTMLSAAESLQALERFGITVDDPDAPLSQGMLSRIMGSLGYQVTTSTPAAAADSFMASAAVSLIGSGGINPLRGLGTELYPPPNTPGGCLFDTLNCLECCLRLRVPLAGCQRMCTAVSGSPSNPT